MSDEEKLIKIPITQLVKFSDSFAGAEIHLSVAGKFVRLNYATDEFLDILRRLQQKEVEQVYIRQSEVKVIMKEIQESLSARKFYQSKTTVEEKVEVLDESMKTVKNIINQIGVDSETVTLLRLVNVRTMSILQESPGLYAFIKRFKKNCSEEFLRAMLTSYVLALMVDKFPWRSESVKEKGAMASLLCDLLLDKKDFEILRKWEKDGGELPEHIRNHPFEIAEKLRQKRDLIPFETITIIEQHHEMPDGSGFPDGINGGRINQLSAIFIVSQRFIELLCDTNFDYEMRFLIVGRLQKKYQGKSFEKAMEALTSIVR